RNDRRRQLRVDAQEVEAGKRRAIRPLGHRKLRTERKGRSHLFERRAALGPRSSRAAEAPRIVSETRRTTRDPDAGERRSSVARDGGRSRARVRDRPATRSATSDRRIRARFVRAWTETAERADADLRTRARVGGERDRMG